MGHKGSWSDTQLQVLTSCFIRVSSAVLGLDAKLPELEDNLISEID